MNAPEEELCLGVAAESRGAGGETTGSIPGLDVALRGGEESSPLALRGDDATGLGEMELLLNTYGEGLDEVGLKCCGRTAEEN